MKSKTKSKLDLAQVEQLVRKHFTDSASLPIKELTDGMFNSAWLIEGSHSLSKGVVLKVGPLPETEILTYEKNILQTEVEVYRLLKEKPIPIPALLAYDFTRNDIPCDYFFMERMEGSTWKSYGRQFPKESRPNLMHELGRCNAVIHSVEGPWFGYIKEEKRFQFDTWGEAFTSMIADILGDGKERNYILPYEEITKTVHKHRKLLNTVKVPKLVDFDMWAGNVFLKEDNGFNISGVVDFERSFYGDPFADFTSAMMLFKDVEREPDFCMGYQDISGKALTVSDADRIRMDLYRLYMAIILFVETYRYGKAYGWVVQRYSIGQIKRLLKILG
jgi:aminoglycoside phosphotransferase (APT) family kinase protein